MLAEWKKKVVKSFTRIEGKKTIKILHKDGRKNPSQEWEEKE